MTPVVFIFFNKIDTTLEVFERIKSQKPSKLYLVSDGPRNEKESEVVNGLREAVEKEIDWNPLVEKVYSDTNLGCKNRIVSGLNYVFEREKRAIIIEDDVLPQKSFFDYCEQMLDRFDKDNRIMLVSGLNIVGGKNKYSYGFSKNANIWGWATWKRVWEQYDPNIYGWKEYKESNRLMIDNGFNEKQCEEYTRCFDGVYEKKIDAWGYQFLFMCFRLQGLSVFPSKNLVKNLGFNEDTATHTVGKIPTYYKKVFSKNEELVFPLIHPIRIEADEKHDEKEWKIKHKDDTFWISRVNAFWRWYHRLVD